MAIIPQVDGTFDQNRFLVRDEKVRMDEETQTEEVSEIFPVLRNWDEEIRHNPYIDDLCCLNQVFSEPPPSVVDSVNGIGVYEKMAYGQFFYKFSDGKSRAC